MRAFNVDGSPGFTDAQVDHLVKQNEDGSQMGEVRWMAQVSAMLLPTGAITGEGRYAPATRNTFNILNYLALAASPRRVD